MNIPWHGSGGDETVSSSPRFSGIVLAFTASLVTTAAPRLATIENPDVQSPSPLAPSYLRSAPSRDGIPPGETHLMICVCDHFEPFHDATREEAVERVRRWEREYPDLARPCAIPPASALRHTFFYPIEQYDEEVPLQPRESLPLHASARRKSSPSQGRHAPRTSPPRSRTGKRDLAGHGLLSTDPGGRHPVRIHPRQLGAGQFPPRRAALRRAQ